MDPRRLFFDERLAGSCVYCGGPAETRDHVPSRVLLDEPFPPDLPVVPACIRCNNRFSLSEEYLACFLECVICGSANTRELSRDSIRRRLAKRPALASKIAMSASHAPEGTILWKPDEDHVISVIHKLARGHLAFEGATPRIDNPALALVAPLSSMTREEVESFFATTISFAPWPEIGSRAFFRASGSSLNPPIDEQGWVQVQPGRYRYRVQAATVQLLISEYLAATVSWD